MFRDPIVDEIRKIRDDYARSFNYDLRAIRASPFPQENRNDSYPMRIDLPANGECTRFFQ
jgi:hypothetical protein